jgi:trimeric autotransporter adhesin
MIRTVHRYLSLLPALLLALAAESRAQGTLMPELGAPAGTGGEHASAAAAGDDQWSSAIDAFNVDGPVFEAVAAPNGDLYIGGNFTSVGGVQANRIARWDGTAWHALGGGIPAGTVYAIAFNGSDMYVGGSFKGAGDIKATNIARWDGTAWHSLGDITREGLDSTVLAIAVHNGNLIVGGNFTYSLNSDLLNYLALYTPADSTFRPINDGTRAGTDGGVAALCVVPATGDVYAGGAFTKAGGINAARVARWNGTEWSSLGAGVAAQPGGPTPYVRTLAFRDSIVIAGGTFTFAGGKPTKYVARWSLDTQSWGGLAGAGVNGTDAEVNKVVVAPSGLVYVTGAFSTAGGQPANRIAAWKSAADGWSTMGSGLNEAGYAIAGIGTKIWVGGAFTEAGAKPSRYLAQWDETPTGSGVAGDASGDAMKLGAVRWKDGNGEISFTLEHAATARIEIIDMRGQVVAMPVDGFTSAGSHTAVWNAAGMPAGLYLCRLQSGSAWRSAKIVLAR